MQAGEYSIGLVLINELITILVFAVVVYTNLLFLFPAYLKPGRFLLYLAGLIGLSVVFTPMELVIKYFLFSYRETIQVDLLNNMEAYFLGNFLIGGISSMGKIMTDWIAENRKKQEVENETMQSELRFLKSQINPHFLFNTLNSLYALTLKKSDKAPDIVIKLSEMMRYMLYECNEPKVPLRKEINYLQNYLDLERLRQREGIDITLDVQGTSSTSRSPPCCSSPFSKTVSSTASTPPSVGVSYTRGWRWKRGPSVLSSKTARATSSPAPPTAPGPAAASAWSTSAAASNSSTPTATNSTSPKPPPPTPYDLTWNYSPPPTSAASIPTNRTS